MFIWVNCCISRQPPCSQIYRPLKKSISVDLHCLKMKSNNPDFICPQMLKDWVTLERSNGCVTRSRSAWRTTSTTGSTTLGAASGSCCCCCRRYRASPGRWLNKSSLSNFLEWPRLTTCCKKCFLEVSPSQITCKQHGLERAESSRANPAHVDWLCVLTHRFCQWSSACASLSAPSPGSRAPQQQCHSGQQHANADP